MDDGRHDAADSEARVAALTVEVEALRRRLADLERGGAGELPVHPLHPQHPQHPMSGCQALFTYCPMGILIYRLEADDRLVLTAANPAASSILGIDVGQLVGRTIEEAFPPLAATDIPDAYREVCRSGRTWSTEQVDYDDARVKGAFEVHAFPTEPGSVGVLFLDISTRLREGLEREALREQLNRAQRMEAIGRLASGVAHDLNNVLSGILSYPELMLEELPEESPLRADLEAIQSAGESATAIVADLLTIARGVTSDKLPVNLNAVVGSCLATTAVAELTARHPEVVLETYLADTALTTTCSEAHVSTSLLNLMANAFEACGGRGRVSLSTRDQYVDQPLASYDAVQIGEYVVVRVEDTGAAIDPVHLPRVFEPFYTKKVLGRKGTGLGLAVVWTTMQDHEGYVDLGSGPAGNWVELYFPATREEVAQATWSVPIEDCRGRGERVLVVDDEPRQRIIAARMLSHLGYSPEVAGSGERALEMVAAEGYDVVLLDMIMPGGLNGRETYQRLVEVRPGQKAVIASGFAVSDEVLRAQALGAGRYLRKPYSLEELALAIRDELKR